MLYTYDPYTNILLETSYEELKKITGLNPSRLKSFIAKSKKVPKFNFYITEKNISIEQKKIWYARENYENECWKQISNTDYLISSYGRVKRKFKRFGELILPLFDKRDGQMFVNLNINGKGQRFYISRLVAEYFLDKPSDEQKKLVYHKNRIKTDNYFLNLTYLSRSELSRLTVAKSRSKAVVEIDETTLEVIEEYRSAKEAAEKTFMSHTIILKCCQGKVKYACGKKFMLESDYLKIIGKKQVS